MAKATKKVKKSVELDETDNKEEGEGETALALFQPTVVLKKNEIIPERRKAIESLRQEVNKQFKGGAVVRLGSEITNVFMLRRPSGITNLDLAIGGGVPAGGLTQIIGKYSAGKSYLVNRIMATAQENYGDEFAASACMTEQRFDKHFAKWKCGLRIGLSDEEITILQHIAKSNSNPEFTEEQITWLKDEVGTFSETMASNAEQLLEIACQQVESNLFQIVLVDSFGALLTKAEAEADEGLEQKHRGGAAMVVTQFMHRLHAALNLPDRYGRPNTTSVIGINQYRDNVNAGLYGNPMKIAGGNALAHGKLLDIHLEQGKRLWHEFGAKDKRIVGKEINWEIVKGKAGCHDGPRGTYSFYFGEHGYGFGVDTFTDLLVAGLRTDVVQQNGAWYSFEGENIGQGESGASAAISKNPELLQKIRKAIFKEAGLNFITKEKI